MIATRSLMLAALAGVCLPLECYAAPANKSAGAAPVAPKPAPVPVAPKPPAPAPQAPAPQAVTQEAAKLTASRSFDIEDDIPLPVKRIGVKGESIYPFATIGINQSFFVAATDTIKEPWKTLTSMASRMSRDLYPKKFITARQEKNGVEGVRIWRAADETKPLAPPRKKPAKAATEAAAEPEAEAQVEGEAATGAEGEAAAE